MKTDLWRHSFYFFLVYFENIRTEFLTWFSCISHFYSYLIENDVCYLVLAEKNYSKRLAFSYLEDLAQEFNSQYGKKVNTVTRPYSLIEFGKNEKLNWTYLQRTCGVIMLLYFITYCVLNFSDNYIQKAKKVFTDSRARRNLSSLNTELQDVQRIMVQNIDDVLQRGVVLSGSIKLLLMSQSSIDSLLHGHITF